MQGRYEQKILFQLAYLRCTYSLGMSDYSSDRIVTGRKGHVAPR